MRPTAVAVLTCAVFLGSAYAAYSVTAARDRIEWYRPKTTLSDATLTGPAYEDIKAHENWPLTRTDPGPHEFADNDPLLLGGEGGSYYSSYLPAATARTLRGLGAGWYIQGRHTLSFDDPAGRALMGVSSFRTGPVGRPVTVHRTTGAPLVTVRPEDAQGAKGAEGPAITATTTDDGDTGRSVFDRQEAALGADVYEVPELVPVRATPDPLASLHSTASTASTEHLDTLEPLSSPAPLHHLGPLPPPGRPLGTGAAEDPAGRAPVPADGGWSLPATPGAAAVSASAAVQESAVAPAFTARCTPGTTAYWYAPWYSGEVSAAGATSPGYGDREMTANPVRRLGKVPADGRLTVRFRSPAPQKIPEHAIGCLSPRRLDAAVGRLRSQGPVRLSAGGHGLTAELRAHSTGTAVVAVPAVEGWTCAVDGGPDRPPRAVEGLMAVPLGAGATRLTCSYAAPGLTAGLVASGAAALTVAVVATMGAMGSVAGTGPGRPRRRGRRTADQLPSSPVPSPISPK
ncbi:YfhO family protein [Streptomyces sp. MST-110588]|uniref:YfhO family protein n=1 Tax=Streptomyces sp. MST-110588 TaxID=2833628 RepID=UPI001F5D29CE|nr:YfhO family protein [Streptomyces sp. MST-110588]UNO41733.1 YfhO family protein [Streptomyces sp. MST-110588]